MLTVLALVCFNEALSTEIRKGVCAINFFSILYHVMGASINGVVLRRVSGQRGNGGSRSN